MTNIPPINPRNSKNIQGSGNVSKKGDVRKTDTDPTLSFGGKGQPTKSAKLGKMTPAPIDQNTGQHWIDLARAGIVLPPPPNKEE